MAAVRRLARRFAATWPTIPLDEFAQEARIRLPRFRDRFDPKRGRPWASFRDACVRNVFRDMTRRERYRLSLLRPLDALDDRAAAPEANADLAITRREAQLDLLRAVLRLTPTEATVVQLTLMDAPDEEISRLTGRSLAAIQTARCRAIPRLRQFLGGSLA